MNNNHNIKGKESFPFMLVFAMSPCGFNDDPKSKFFLLPRRKRYYVRHVFRGLRFQELKSFSECQRKSIRNAAEFRQGTTDENGEKNT
jgi:hypothetical protein